jgi:hypothetical protein
MLLAAISIFQQRTILLIVNAKQYIFVTSSSNLHYYYPQCILL